MSRVLMVAALLCLGPLVAAQQTLGVLRVKVSLLDGEGKVTPVPQHALLVSDNPSSAPPRRVTTGLDGTLEIRLRPGNYTIESDRPMAFLGRAYQWTQTVDVAAGRDVVLELTAANAEVSAASDAATAAGSSPADPPPTDSSALLMQWRDSVVALWTPTTHASGVLIDSNGLIVTNQQVVGAASTVEVQISPTVKVAARVVEANPTRDIAIVRVDPAVTASIRPLPLGCADAAGRTARSGDDITTIGYPLRQRKGTAFGSVTRVSTHVISSDLSLATGSSGGPVFDTSGNVLGVTSLVDDGFGPSRRNAKVIRVGDVCEVLAAAAKKLVEAQPPPPTPLPVDPERPFPVDRLDDAAKRRGGNLNQYQMSTADYDLTFLTPVLTYAAQYQWEQLNRRGRGQGGRTQEPSAAVVDPLMDFSNWSEYVSDYPAVLLIRATPRFVEGFWTKVARGAASTQGVSLPPIKRFKPGFARLRAYCGDREVTPIHPFKLELRVSESDALYEGLYAFDPAALGPSCSSVKVVLYSEKELDKGDTRTVDPKIVQQVWQDFALTRSPQ